MAFRFTSGACGFVTHTLARDPLQRPSASELLRNEWLAPVVSVSRVLIHDTKSIRPRAF